MGANNIILVGHDCGLLNGELHMKSYILIVQQLSLKGSKSEYLKWLNIIESQTLLKK